MWNTHISALCIIGQNWSCYNFIENVAIWFWSFCMKITIPRNDDWLIYMIYKASHLRPLLAKQWSQVAEIFTAATSFPWTFYGYQMTLNLTLILNRKIGHSHLHVFQSDPHSCPYIFHILRPIQTKLATIVHWSRGRLTIATISYFAY